MAGSQGAGQEVEAVGRTSRCQVGVWRVGRRPEVRGKGGREPDGVPETRENRPLGCPEWGGGVDQ